MNDNPLHVLRDVHAASTSEVPFDLVEKVYNVEREYQYEEDPHIRHTAIRTIVTLAVDEIMKGDGDGEVNR
jgi:hypothetical protein